MFGLIGIQAKIAEWLIVVAVVAGAAYWVYNSGYEAAEKKALVELAQANKEARDKYNLIEKKLEDKKNVRQENARVITKEVEKIVDRVVYSSECWDSDGLLNANDAISGRNQSKPSSTVPPHPTD